MARTIRRHSTMEFLGINRLLSTVGSGRNNWLLKHPEFPYFWVYFSISQLDMDSLYNPQAYNMLRESWLEFVGEKREIEGLSPYMPYLEMDGKYSMICACHELKPSSRKHLFWSPILVGILTEVSYGREFPGLLP
jgi:hypothetical protein